MGTSIQTRKIMQDSIDNLKPFKRGNISAERFNTGDYIHTGELPSFLQSQLNGLNLDYTVYVVFSYKTPIGWIAMGQTNATWFIPEVTYSISTTHHQHLLMVITDNPGFYQKF